MNFVKMQWLLTGLVLFNICLFLFLYNWQFHARFWVTLEVFNTFMMSFISYLLPYIFVFIYLDVYLVLTFMSCIF